MTYQHGIYVQENPTSVMAPITTDSAVIFVVGTAPVNLVANPAGSVNKPILINSFAEAKEKLGYSNSFGDFTICQLIDAAFRIYNVGPIVAVNVLDPNTHKIAVTSQLESVVNGQVTIDEEGIMLSTLVVKNTAGATTYAKGTDYTADFDKDGYVVVKRVSTGTITAETAQLSFSFDKLDPSAVDEADIIGGYTSGVYSGLENISQVYPQLGIVPGIIVVPGWSHKPTVGAAMTAKTENINGAFKCVAVKDVDSSSTGADLYTEVANWKSTNSYTDKHDIVVWPKVKNGSKVYYFSAVLAALIAYTDAQNDDVPYVSPSNKSLRITGTVLESGTEVYLDQVQANTLNAQGIVTAINLAGWKAWGNNTGAYPSSTDIKDRFIPVRRMFDWWGNSFIQTYFQQIDDPTNTRLIETLVDSENIRANGYKAKQQIADARIEFNIDENPTADLVNGIIRFKQYLTPYPPAESIVNVLEFSPNALTASLTGGEA
jgi:phage tail sheath protein FI